MSRIIQGDLRSNHDFKSSDPAKAGPPPFSKEEMNGFLPLAKGEE